MSASDDRAFLIQRCRDQERLLSAYRGGTLRPPEDALDRLTKGRDRWEQLRTESR